MTDTTKPGPRESLDASSRRVPLLFVSALVRALSHQIRTPLSVISNELNYFKSLLPADECNRSIERCKSIADILSQSSPKCLHQVGLSRTALLDLTAGRDGLKFDVQALNGKFALINLDQIKTGLAFAEKALLVLGETLGESLSVGGGGCEYCLEIKLKPELQSVLSNLNFQFLTELLCEKLESDSSLAPLADALFWGGGVRTSIIIESHLKFKLFLDLVAQ